MPAKPKPGGIPKAARPRMPAGYGISKARAGLLPWSHVEERMAASKNYWIVTARPDGRPHAMPVWGVWLDRTVYFGTDRSSRKARNLAHSAAIVVHLESGDDPVIVEGTVREVSDEATLARVDEAYRKKYKMRLREAPGDLFVAAVSPRVVFAWRERDFPKSATRWVFA